MFQAFNLNMGLYYDIFCWSKSINFIWGRTFTLVSLILFILHLRAHIFSCFYAGNPCLELFTLSQFNLRTFWPGLMVFYLEKVATTLAEKNNTQYSQKEVIFRSILALHSLLENPAGDFPDNLREDIVKGFVKIFSYIRYTVVGTCMLSFLFCLRLLFLIILCSGCWKWSNSCCFPLLHMFRNEGKVSRKLIECINTYLLKDGLNLSCQSLEIHNAVQQFVFHCWLMTHDKGLKVNTYSNF